MTPHTDPRKPTTRCVWQWRYKKNTLPAVIATSVLLLKRKPLAYTLAPSFIVFLILTGVPILLTPVVQAARRETAAWGVVVPIGTLIVVLLSLLAWLLSTMYSPEHPTGALDMKG